MRLYNLGLFSVLSISLLLTTSLEGAFCKKKKSADYIIVGVGTAGATVAKMLTDDLKTSVIALHSGEDLTNDPLIKYEKFVPITVIAGILPTPLYENGGGIPQVDADNRVIDWTLALPFGGASAINAGAWCRGTNEVYSQWEAIAGPNWSVNRITGIYKALENYNGVTTDPAARGFNGPLTIRQNPNPTQVSTKFTQAITNATGFLPVIDYNDPNTPIGPSQQIQITQSVPDGILRVSSVTAFLNESVMTPNGHGVNGRKLTVLFDSFALRTLWKGNKAIGVEYSKGGRTKKIYAKKGVIVCAGLRSSVFLMQSGVGPADLLESLNIPVIYDNPNVGQGLADQPRVNVYFTTNPTDTPASNGNAIITQISWLPDPLGDPTSRQLRLALVNPFPGFTLGLFDLVQPKSRGSVSINSADPFDPPVIDQGMLTNDDDLNTFINGFQIYLKNINTAVNAIDGLYELIYPDAAILDDVVALTEFIKETIDSNMHFQSHCLMAPQNQGGVVDSTGHVYGVQNLIVADDSIVPLDMDGSPMASAYLIGANIALLLQGK